MAKTWITDRWVKPAQAKLGNTTVRLDPTPAELKNLDRLPDHFKTSNFKQGKRWQVRWRDEHKQLKSKSFDNLAEAEEHAASLEDSIRAGTYIPAELRNQKFAQLAETWLKTKISAKPVTVARYKKELDLHVLPKWGTRDISTITREEIQDWVHELATGTHPYAGKKATPLSPASILHIVKKTFAGILKYAHEEGWLVRNPATRVVTPAKKYVEELPVLTYMEVEQLAAAAKNRTGQQTDRALILLLATCGIRIGEATALKVSDIDYERQRIRIMRGWSKDADGNPLLSSPKTGKPRTVPLPTFLIDELKPLTKDQPASAWLFRAKRKPSEAVNYHNFAERVWRPVLRASSIDPERGITLHKLRHTAASHAIAAGADIKVLQLMLGHASAVETLDTYGHWLPDKLDTIAESISARREQEMGL